MKKKLEKTKAIKLPTKHGDFMAIGFKDKVNNKNHIALIKGDISEGKNILVRVHSECLTGDVFGSKRCDCGAQLDYALKLIEEEGRGIVLYMRQEGRGIGLINKLKAYALQDEGRDTVEANEDLGFDADLRDYSIGAQILNDLGVKSVKLITNNPNKITGMKKNGLIILKRVPNITKPTKHNEKYLNTKKNKLGHFLDN